MIVGLMLALVVGWQLGSGSLFIPVVCCGGLAYVILVSLLRCHWEAVFIGLLIFGYLFGNRGFAQLMPPGLPMLPGEAGVLLVTLALCLRLPLERDFPFRINALTVFLLLWAGTSAVHMIFDLPRGGFMAIRDFAMVYYALFFFGGMSMGRREKSVLVLEWSLGLGFAFMCIGYLIFLAAPEAFLQLSYRGAPVIYYKGDLVGIFAAAAIPFYYGVSTRRENMLEKLGLTLLMGLAAGVLFLTLARSAMVGLAVGLFLMTFAGHFRVFIRLFLVGVLGIGVVIAADLMQERTLAESHIYGVFEHTVSLVDFGGHYDYQNPDSLDTGDNNRFRLVWWETLTKHVMEHGPVAGMGFGYDLANPFLAEYYPTGNQTFRTRSPHNFLLSVFGRTGLIGVLCWALMLAAITFQCIWLVRRQKAKEPLGRQLMYQIMAIVIFIGALFQVVLEGPMGAVMFWLLLGMAQQPVKETSG